MNEKYNDEAKLEYKDTIIRNCHRVARHVKIHLPTRVRGTSKSVSVVQHDSSSHLFLHRSTDRIPPPLRLFYSRHVCRVSEPSKRYIDLCRIYSSLRHAAPTVLIDECGRTSKRERSKKKNSIACIARNTACVLFLSLSI